MNTMRKLVIILYNGTANPFIILTGSYKMDTMRKLVIIFLTVDIALTSQLTSLGPKKLNNNNFSKSEPILSVLLGNETNSFNSNEHVAANNDFTTHFDKLNTNNSLRTRKSSKDGPGSDLGDLRSKRSSLEGLGSLLEDLYTQEDYLSEKMAAPSSLQSLHEAVRAEAHIMAERAAEYDYGDESFEGN